MGDAVAVVWVQAGTDRAGDEDEFVDREEIRGRGRGWGKPSIPTDSGRGRVRWGTDLGWLKLGFTGLD